MNVAALLQDSPSDDHDHRRRQQQQQQQQQQQREREWEREQPQPPPRRRSPPQERGLERDSRPTPPHLHHHHHQPLAPNPSYSPHATRHPPPPSPPHRYVSDYEPHGQRMAPPPPLSSSSGYAPPPPFEMRRRSDPEQPRVHEIALHHHGPAGGHPGPSAIPYTVEHRPLPPPPRPHAHHSHQHAQSTPGAQSPMYMPPPARPPLHGASTPKPGPPGPGVPPVGHGAIPLFPTPVGPGVPSGPPTNNGLPPGPGMPPLSSRTLHSPHGFAGSGMEPSPMYGHPSSSLPPLSTPHHHPSRPRTSGSFDYPRTSPIMGSLQRPQFERDEHRHGPSNERRDERERDMRDRSDRDRDGGRGAQMPSGLGGPGSLHQHGAGPGMSMNANARVAGPGAPPPLAMPMSNVLSGPGAVPMVGVGAKEREREWERERERAMEREREINNARERERERERDMRNTNGNGGMMGESPRDRHRGLKERDIMREREREEGIAEMEAQRDRERDRELRERDWLRRTQIQEPMQGLPPGQAQQHSWSRFATPRTPAGPYAEDERERERRAIHEVEMDRERVAREEAKLRERRDRERFAEEEARAREARDVAEAEKGRRRPASKEKAAREKEERRMMAREEQISEQERKWMKEQERERMQRERAEMDRRQGQPQSDHHHVRHQHHSVAPSGKSSKPPGGLPHIQPASGPRELQPMFANPDHLRHSNSMQFRQGSSKIIDGPVHGVSPLPHGQPQHHHQHPPPPHPLHPHPPMHIHPSAVGGPNGQHRDTPPYVPGMHPHMPAPIDMLYPASRASPPRKSSSKAPTSRLGTFVYPRTPFPFTDFPSSSTSSTSGSVEPVTLYQYRATILIPSGFLPTHRPARPRIWGGAMIPALPAIPPLSEFTSVPYRDSRPHAYEARGMRRVYTDDSDLFLCALHAGLLAWSETRRAKAEGKDLRMDVRITKEARFIGGFGSPYVNGPSFAGPEGVGVYGSDDDGSSLLSAGWGNSHDGAGIEIVSANWVPKGTAHAYGLRNRKQRLAEYAERRSVVCEVPRPRKKRRLDRIVVDVDSPVILDEQHPDLELCTAATITFGFGRAWKDMQFKHPPPSLVQKDAVGAAERLSDVENIPPSPSRKRRRSESPSAAPSTDTPPVSKSDPPTKPGPTEDVTDVTSKAVQQEEPPATLSPVVLEPDKTAMAVDPPEPTSATSPSGPTPPVQPPPESTAVGNDVTNIAIES